MIFNFIIPYIFLAIMNLFDHKPHVVHYMGVQKFETSSKIITIDSINDKTKFYNVDSNLVNIFYKIQSEFNKPLQIVWGYRDEKTNRDVGGAKRSAHLQGKAFDLVLKESNKEDIKKLIKLATKYNILGIGVYRDAKTIHIDIDQSKGRRVWGSNYSSNTVPSWAKIEVKEHLNHKSVISNTDTLVSKPLEVKEITIVKKIVIEKKQKPVYYTIQKGNTLYSLSKNYETTVEKICKLNNISNPANIKIGQKIRVL